MNKFALIAIALSLPVTAFANTSATNLLKRTDVKSYEGFMQVAPRESPKLSLDISFIRPAFDYRPVSSGAMVGLIQNIGSINGIRVRFSEKCVGDIKIKIGVKEFSGSQYGHVQTSWNINRFTNGISLRTAIIKDKETDSSEKIGRKSIKMPSSKSGYAYISLPYPIKYYPGDVLVLDEIEYSTNEDRIFSQCFVRIEET